MDHDGESGEVGVADREAREALEPVVVPEELFVSVLSSVEGRGGGGSFRSLGMSPSVAVAVAVTPGPGSSSTVRLILMMSKQDGGVLVLIQRFW